MSSRRGDIVNYTYDTILGKAKTCQSNVKKEYKLGITSRWSYYFAKAILTPKKDISKIDIKDANDPTGTHISQQISKNDYLDMCKRLVKFVEKHHQLPNYVGYKDYKIKPRLLTEMLSRILIYYDTHGAYASKAHINSKVFTKPVETKNEVYNYFVDVFGSFGNTIDGALKKIAGKGYGYYYDDVYSNKESINRMKNGKGVNCTDSCQVFFNIMLQLIELKKYKKVECLHVKCQGGDGHVRLRITLNDGTQIYRDPAAVLDSGNITHNWCMNGTIIAINPTWFMQNLNR